MRTLITIAALLIAGPAIAQEIPAIYGPTEAVYIDSGSAAGIYATPIGVVSEESFSNGDEVCAVFGTSCAGAITFNTPSGEHALCGNEVAVGDTFIALCR